MILGTRGSAQQSRRGYAVPALARAELDAEPAAGIVPFQRAPGPAIARQVPHSWQAAYSTEMVPSGSSLYTWAGQQQIGTADCIGGDNFRTGWTDVTIENAL
jgi:hypothetical protein